MPDFVSPDPIWLHARIRPASTAAIDLAMGMSWTYRELDTDIQRAVTVLEARGVEPGARIAVLAQNSVYQIILQQAAMRLGAIFVPMNYRLAALELRLLLRDCTPVLLVGEAVASALPEGCEAISMAAFADLVAAAEPRPRRTAAIASHETCIILYTSGTSGTPKGAMLTPQFLLATAVNFNILGEVDTGCVFLCDSPMFHVIGIVTQIWPPLLRGGTVIVSPSFDPELTNARLSDATLAVTHYFCVPQMAEALRHASNFNPSQWTNLKALFTGGAPNPPTRIRWWLDQGVLIVDGYGMTETGTTLGMPLNWEIVRNKAGSVGVPGPLTAVRLVDETDQDVADGAPGEILVFGPNVTPGYWNRPEERERAFTADGWIRTGDIGRRDGDGFISIVDRRKDMFISGGENVFPVEIEAALISHPAVREASVIGIADERWGEVGRAYIVVATGQSLDADELVEYCRTLIARYKIPKEFHFVDTLPRTTSGKVMKHILRSGDWPPPPPSC
ncbi:AMP-binding protein [Mesorhizobium sp. Cs1330R2N1]|uniref:AMP-binding protein n=2 Tax=Mesorhizobium argentiipisi TaxID=3015175 RepID=A0ABU8KGN6_9HYPH